MEMTAFIGEWHMLCLPSQQHHNVSHKDRKLNILLKYQSYRRFLKHGYELDVGSYQLSKRLQRTAKIADVAHVRLWREYVFQKALYCFAYLIFGVTFDVDLPWSKTPELNTFLGEFYYKKLAEQQAIWKFIY